MSGYAMIWAMKQTIRPSARKFTLVAIAEQTDFEGYSYPSHQLLADMTEQGISTIREHIRELEHMGYISREHRQRKNGSRTTDRVRLLAPPEALTPAPKDPPRTGSGRPSPPPPRPTLPPESGARKQYASEGLPPESGVRKPILPPESGYPDPERLDLLGSSEDPRVEIREVKKDPPPAQAPSAPPPSATKKKPSDAGTRIPERFLLTAKMREWAARKAPDVDPVRTTEAFVYHWRGKAGKDGRKVDWLATWYSWMLKEQVWAEQRNNGHRPQAKSKVEMSLEAARQVAAKFREGDDTQS